MEPRADTVELGVDTVEPRADTATAAGTARSMTWSWCSNARDLGGLTTEAGERVQPGRLFRADCPTGSAAEIFEQLAAAGISRVVDLRAEREAAGRPSPLRESSAYRLVPMIDPRMDRLRDPDAERNLQDTYRGSLDRNGQAIAAGVTAVAEAPPGGVLVHCLAGKDRTGILIALMLSAIGVRAEEIVADYAMSADQLREFFAKELEEASDPGHRDRLKSRQHSDAETMQGTLDYAEQRYGGAREYLRGAGVSDESMSALTERLLGQSTSG